MDLRAAARAAGVTGRQIAAVFGVSEPTVSRWLAGKWDIPTPYVRDLARLLNISPTAILPPPTRVPKRKRTPTDIRHRSDNHPTQVHKERE